jgi:hypothetical protein
MLFYSYTVRQPIQMKTAQRLTKTGSNFVPYKEKAGWIIYNNRLDMKIAHRTIVKPTKSSFQRNRVKNIRKLK